MQVLNESQQQQVSGGCSPECVPVDRRPVSPLGSSYDSTNPGISVPAGWANPLPQPRWPNFSAQ